MSHREEELERSLRGTTLRAYWLLLRTGRPMGVREVQRALRLSSSSVAQYHLERLEGLGLVKKQVGGHNLLMEEVKVGC